MLAFSTSHKLLLQIKFPKTINQPIIKPAKRGKKGKLVEMVEIWLKISLGAKVSYLPFHNQTNFPTKTTI